MIPIARLTGTNLLILAAFVALATDTAHSQNATGGRGSGVAAPQPGQRSNLVLNADLTLVHPSEFVDAVAFGAEGRSTLQFLPRPRTVQSGIWPAQSVGLRDRCGKIID